MMDNFFKTEDIVKLTGLTRSNLEYYRKEKIIEAVSYKPLRFNYKTLIFCLMIKVFKDKMNRNLAIDCTKHFLEFHKNLDFIEDDNELIIISEMGKKFIIFISKESDDLANEDGEFFKYYEDSYFLDIDDINTGRRLQIILDNRYVFYLKTAKEHINKLCIDYGLADKIPSLSMP